MGLGGILKEALGRRCRRIYEKQRARRLYTQAEYLADQKKLVEKAEKDAGQAENPEEKKEIERIRQDLLFVTLVKGTMDTEAELHFARAFYEHPEAVAAYCDEVEAEGENTWFKPEWSPDTFLDHYYFGGLTVLRKSASSDFLDRLGAEDLCAKELWEICFQIIEKNGGFCRRKDGEKIVLSIPEVLFTRESGKGEILREKGSSPARRSNGRTKGTERTEEFPLENHPLENHPPEVHPLEADLQTRYPEVSIVIPSKDHPELLEKCIRSIRRTVGKVSYEILVVDNGSGTENRQKLEELAKILSFRYLYRPMSFHFARMCNLGAHEAKGKHVLFLNDDIECISPGWLEKMRELGDREHVGAVGSKLLYPDGMRIQHAGITNLPMGPVHKLQFLQDCESYYDGYNRGVRNVLAVTGACLLMRRELYLACGGMSEELAVAFNDVELCFKLYEMGYVQAVQQDFPLYHHESFSRGDDEASEKWKRLMKEREILYRLHPKLAGADPFYSIHLNRRGLDSRIVPAYRTGKQEKEIASSRAVKKGIPHGAREDACLLLSVEICREGELCGYGVVAGSDNALFRKELLLRKGTEEAATYRVPFLGQYRSDLEENMPDQVHVGLSGFWVELADAEIPEGTYQVGMYARDLTGRTGIYWFSSREICFCNGNQKGNKYYGKISNCTR